MSKSLNLAKQYLNKIVTVTIDRPLGSKHPKWDYIYPINYGYIDGVIAPDGESLDAYVLNIRNPVDKFEGKCIAVIHRLDDDDDKLIVAPEKTLLTDAEIEEAVKFQEQYFKHKILRS